MKAIKLHGFTYWYDEQEERLYVYNDKTSSFTELRFLTDNERKQVFDQMDRPCADAPRSLDTETKIMTHPKGTLAIAPAWSNCLVRITGEGLHGCIYADVLTGSNKDNHYYTDLKNLIIIPDSQTLIITIKPI